MVQVAVLDDWQGVARQSADFAALEARAAVTVFSGPFADEAAAAAALAPFEVLIAMRERTAFSATLLARLPRLKMIALTGLRAATLDLAACTRQGVLVCNTGGGNSGIVTAELALGLLLAAARSIAQGDAAIRAGRFQEGIPLGRGLEGATLGIIGLGRIGSRVAGYGRALGMRVLGWSPNLTPERAAAAGAEYATRDALLAESDAISLHMVLSAATRGLLGAAELSRMKPGAILVNTSRGPLIDAAALVAAVTQGRIVAALDVYDREPLATDDPLRRAPNTVLTPHLGYVTAPVFGVFYRDAIADVLAFLDGAPVRMLNPEAIGRPPA